MICARLWYVFKLTQTEHTGRGQFSQEINKKMTVHFMLIAIFMLGKEL